MVSVEAAVFIEMGSAIGMVEVPTAYMLSGNAEKDFPSFALHVRMASYARDFTRAKKIAGGYTNAWCSQDADKVAVFFAPNGSLTINGGPPSIGRAAIAAAAQSFMLAFPDLRVRMNRLVQAGNRVEYHWTLTGTNTGPGGTGRAVEIDGFESWRMGADGLVEESLGSFDADDYERQISGGSQVEPEGE